MNQLQLNFSRNEYAARVQRTRLAMANNNLDLIVVSDPSNMSWLTGYDGWSFYTHQAVILGLHGEAIWWGRSMDASGAKRTVTMQHDNIIGYDDSYVQNPNKHPLSLLATLLKTRGWGSLHIGVELDNYYYSAAAHAALIDGLPDASLIDATGLVNWQRAKKSEMEITYMRRAARIVERMFSTIQERAQVGLPKNELVADIYHTAITGADGHWGDYPAIVPMTPSGMDATAPHLTWNDKPLAQGECPPIPARVMVML